MDNAIAADVVSGEILKEETAFLHLLVSEIEVIMNNIGISPL